MKHSCTCRGTVSAISVWLVGIVNESIETDEAKHQILVMHCCDYNLFCTYIKSLLCNVVMHITMLYCTNAIAKPLHVEYQILVMHCCDLCIYAIIHQWSSIGMYSSESKTHTEGNKTTNTMEWLL